VLIHTFPRNSVAIEIPGAIDRLINKLTGGVQLDSDV